MMRARLELQLSRDSEWPSRLWMRRRMRRRMLMMVRRVLMMVRMVLMREMLTKTEMRSDNHLLDRAVG